MNDDKPSLKPCPFCGSKAEPYHMENQIGSLGYAIHCSAPIGDRCGASIGIYRTEEDARISWNTRNEDKVSEYDKCPVGSIVMLKLFEQVPDGFLPCWDESCKIDEYKALYYKIGDIFNTQHTPDGYFSIPYLTWTDKVPCTRFFYIKAK